MIKTNIRWQTFKRKTSSALFLTTTKTQRVVIVVNGKDFINLIYSRNKADREYHIWQPCTIHHTKTYKGKKCTIFRERIASAWFSCGYSTLIELKFGDVGFVEGGKLENPEKNPRSKARTNNKLNPHLAPGRNRTWATLMGGERSHHCANPAPQTQMYGPT